jgi:hypothetical protein
MARTVVVVIQGGRRWRYTASGRPRRVIVEAMQTQRMVKILVAQTEGFARTIRLVLGRDP